MLKYFTSVLYVCPVVLLLGVSECEPTASMPDVQYVLPDNCHEEIVACEWTTWTGTEQEPDPWTCFEGEYFEYAWQEGCPDDDPSSPYCDGRAAKQQSRDGLACVACTANDNEVYWGYPEVFESCPAGNSDCEEQPVPSWKWLRVAVCD